MGLLSDFNNDTNDETILQCVSKKTSPTFLAVTLESIIRFSYCLAHMLLRK